MDDPALQRRVVRAFEHFGFDLPLEAIVAPARPPSRSRLRLATAVVVPVVVVLAIGVLLGRQLATPASVFGSWQPIPSVADPKLAAAARSACLAEGDGGANLLIQDQRGLAAALLFGNGNDMVMCVAFFAANGEIQASTSSGTRVSPQTTTFAIDSVGRAPGFSTTRPGLTWLFGHQPANTGGVVLVLEDGTSVTASSSGGWFLAWWPSDQTVVSMSALDGQRNSVTVPAPEASLGLSPTELPAPSLPNPGGTCSAGQFVVGTPVDDGPGFGTFGSTDDFVTLPLRDVGGNCVLRLPTTIGVAPATGPFAAVNVLNSGVVTAFSVTSGGNVSIVLGDSWFIRSVFAQTGRTPPACAGAISDVSRVEIPLASGSLQIDLGTVWPEVCPDPASVSLTFVTK
jgi:hypothetical protein